MPSSSPSVPGCCFSFFSRKNRQQGEPPKAAISTSGYHAEVKRNIPSAHQHLEPCCSPTQGFMSASVKPFLDDLPAYSSDGKSLSSDVRETIKATIESYRAPLTAISLYISDNPELAYKEYKSSAKLISFLESEGFAIEKDYKGLETAFTATYSQGNGRTWAFNSEYDALPEVGHACGHNLIAIGGVAALLGVRAAMKKHGIDGTVVLMGTPAEEGGAGKVLLIERGGYKGIDGCMMIHPAGFTANSGGVLPTLAFQTIAVEFFGRTTHAGAAPWDGINALDAANISYTSISALRQQLHPTDRVHGIIVDGGEAPNIIPDYTSMKYYVRASRASGVEELMAKAIGCFKGAAEATGCKLKFKTEPITYDLRNNKLFGEEYASAMSELYNVPIPIELGEGTNPGASTDFGNVTYALPACHPMFGIPATLGRGNHTKEFRDKCRTEEAHTETLHAATAMSIVGARFLSDSAFAEDATEWWKDDMKS
ncbi:Peptidase M20 domain-containing protein 2 [Vanrija pseudolonga]|uniref:Peptidase M20 domain-containing protein 2 n=1 Tax=Vanrija pseudolonga TaxID=143232 RepID=A0AAF0Y5S4_9TREE|nr:Peptidase M20 domain-containing protein 2 [Vanrija pseudolonga]